MDEQVRERLIELVRRHGAELTTNPMAAEVALGELRAEHPAEVAVLLAAVEEGLPADVAEADAAEIDGIAAGLQERRAIEHDAARWAVAAWASAVREATQPAAPPAPVAPAAASAGAVTDPGAAPPPSTRESTGSTTTAGAAAPDRRRTWLLVGGGVAVAAVVAGILGIALSGGGGTPTTTRGATDTTTPTVEGTTSTTAATSTTVATTTTAPQPDDPPPIPSYSAGQCVQSGTVVDCDEDLWDFKVLRVLDAGDPATQEYPGEDAFFALADAQCPEDVSQVVLPPNAETWALGDDEVVCGQTSAFLFTPATFGNVPEACVFVDPDDDFLATRCDLRHDWQVLSVLDLGDESAPYPGDAGIEEAAAGCPPEADLYFGPTERTWSQGHTWLLCAFSDNLPFDQIVDITITDLERYWSQTLPTVTGGLEYVSPDSLNPYSEPIESACGTLDTGNAFYCPADDSISWDVDFLRRDFYFPAGDAAVAAVIAHEWGHAITWRLGFEARFWELLESRAASGALGQGEVDVIVAQFGIRKEFQADCLAGAWFGDVFSGNSPDLSLTTNDRNKAIDALIEVRDAGYSFVEANDPGAHGDAQERIANFTRGFDDGAAACLAYYDDMAIVREAQSGTAAPPPGDTADFSTLASLLPAVDPLRCSAFPSEDPAIRESAGCLFANGDSAEFYLLQEGTLDTEYAEVRDNVYANLAAGDVLEDVWHRGDPAAPVGDILVFTDIDGWAWRVWTYRADGIVALAYRTDGDGAALEEWWADNA